jgi:hypothetical protein
MKRLSYIAIVLAIAAFAGTGQNSKLLTTKTAPRSVKAILYYPNSEPETVDLPVEFQVPVDKWDWHIKDGCLEYRIGKEDDTFCGTFKIVRTYD